MGFKQIIKLFFRNARGFFINGIKGATDASNYAGPIVLIIHVALSPVSVPIAALIKTIIDVSTRQPVSHDELAKTAAMFEGLIDEEVFGLQAEIRDETAQSNSSQALIAGLDKIMRDFETKVHRKEQEEGAYIRKKMEETMPAKDYCFTEADKAKIKTATEQYKTAQKPAVALAMKPLIQSYYTAEKNNGKAVHRVIFLYLKHSLSIRQRRAPAKTLTADTLQIPATHRGFFTSPGRSACGIVAVHRLHLPAHQ